MGEISRSGTTGTKGICLCDFDRYIDFVQLPSIEICQFTLLLAKNVLIHSKSHPLVFPLPYLAKQGLIKKESLHWILNRGNP